jgi:hypothetical protein
MAHRWSISLLVAGALSVGCGSPPTASDPGATGQRRAVADGGVVDDAAANPDVEPDGTGGGQVAPDPVDGADASAGVVVDAAYAPAEAPDGGGAGAGPQDAGGDDDAEASGAVGPSPCVLGTSTMGDCVLM